MSPPQPGPPQPGRPQARRLDPKALHAMAHPLRVRLFDELAAFGPATASSLARRTGESSGATSYHLRQLARHGFIEEVPDRGNGRDRWWRLVPGGLELGGDEYLRSGSPAEREAANLLLREWSRGRSERLQHWLSSTTRWPVEWVQASMDSTGHLRLRADELAELTHELHALVTRWIEAKRGREDDDLTDVEIQINTFPLEPRNPDRLMNPEEPR
jgi:DNA-binding transcriptional ArsR family regulator